MIRLGQEEDLSQIKSLLNTKGIREWLGGQVYDSYIKQGQINVAVVDGKIVGASQYTPRESHRWLMNFVGVDPEYRRQGIATSLYQFWEKKALDEGVYVLEDRVVSNNILMPLVLSKLGYVKTASLRSRVKRHHDLDIYVKPLKENNAGLPGDTEGRDPVEDVRVRSCT